MDTDKLNAIKARAEAAAAPAYKPDTVSELTRTYWTHLLISWAEVRLAPPQYDECCRALTQAPPEVPALAADVLALLARVAELEAEKEMFERALHAEIRATMRP